MQRQTPTKRRKVSTTPDTEEMTPEVQSEQEAPENDNVPAVTDDVEIKTESQSDEEVPQSVQDQGPYLIVDHGKRQFEALNSGFLTDVTIFVLDEAIKCHSQVVSFASPKLAAMVKEKEPRLPDVNPRYFRMLLTLIYIGKIPELNDQNDRDVATLLQVGRVAHELQVHAAVVFCATKLVKVVKADSAYLWSILDFAKLIDDAELELNCLKVIRNRAGHLIRTEGFLRCKRDTLESILRQYKLRDVTELQLFQACVAWAKHNAPSDEVESRQAALGSTLRYIRFRTFSAQDFAKHVCPTKLLSAEDERDILRSCVTGEDFMPEEFSENASPRDSSKILVLKLLSSGERKSISEFSREIRTSFIVVANMNTLILGVRMRAWRSNIPEGRLYDEHVHVALQQTIRGPSGILEEATFRGQVKNGDMFCVKFKHAFEMCQITAHFLRVSYAQRGEENLTYQLYKPEKMRCDSGIGIFFADEAVAPPGLHLVVADKTIF